MITSKSHPGYFELTGSNLRENPFSTKHGQEVVSINESFWARMARKGKIVTTGTNFKFALTDISGTPQIVGPSLTVEPGFVLYPKFVTMSADIDCTMIIRITSGQTPTGIAPEMPLYYISKFLKAGTPFDMYFDGDIACDDTNVNPGAGVYIGYATTVTGNMYYSMLGYEVAKQ